MLADLIQDQLLSEHFLDQIWDQPLKLSWFVERVARFVLVSLLQFVLGLVQRRSDSDGVSGDPQ